MNPQEFIRKWKAVLSERAAAQEHFIDLRRLFDHPTPAEDDPTGERFAFEKGLTKTGGGDGFADVWKRGFFAWEYKKRKRNLDAALEQLSRYAAALEYPPLHIASDIDRIVITTAFTNTVPQRHTILLDELAAPANYEKLHAVFYNPEKLRPQQTRQAVTAEAAAKFVTIAGFANPTTRRLRTSSTSSCSASSPRTCVFFRRSSFREFWHAARRQLRSASSTSTGCLPPTATGRRHRHP